MRENWKGVYGQDMISFADDTVHLLFGGRYDWAELGTGSCFGEGCSNFEALLPFNSNTQSGFQDTFARAFSPRLARLSSRYHGCHSTAITFDPWASLLSSRSQARLPYRRRWERNMKVG